MVLTTGSDKTTPAGIMAASTADIPAIVLSGGTMLDGWHDNELVGSGTVIWRSRRMLAAGEINEEEFLQRAAARRRNRPPPPPVPASRSPREALYREKTGQLADGATLDFALQFRRIAGQTPRHNH
ncbi:Dehydratase family protein [Paracidovorax cattleyae]|uniref:Dehydratase family protein n=1 Tax=Paracidovorax cattleyae TaxID=80868 RepID=A0A1H0QM74_9BURK|nr:Dehydratase family protein [Paracidovorax cattleyae]